MRITEDVRTYAAEHGLEEAEALEAGMKERTEAFREAGGELHVPAGS